MTLGFGIVKIPSDVEPWCLVVTLGCAMIVGGGVSTADQVIDTMPRGRKNGRVAPPNQ